MGQCIPDLLSYALIVWAIYSAVIAVKSGKIFVRSFSPETAKEHWQGRECYYSKEPFIFAIALALRGGIIVLCCMALLRISLS